MHTPTFSGFICITFRLNDPYSYVTSPARALHENHEYVKQTNKTVLYLLLNIIPPEHMWYTKEMRVWHGKQ